MKNIENYNDLCACLQDLVRVFYSNNLDFLYSGCEPGFECKTHNLNITFDNFWKAVKSLD